MGVLACMLIVVRRPLLSIQSYGPRVPRLIPKLHLGESR
jgi:hypothetical protein